jgi:hypothetical protein
VWLSGNGPEPGWPAFERELPHPRHRYTVGQSSRERREEDKSPELYTDHQAAALWLGKAGSIFDVAKRPWLRDIVRAYSGWTSVANGSELEKGEDADRTPDQWNEAYFGVLARCLPGLTTAEIGAIGLDLILGLFGEAFLDAMAIFLRQVDTVYFSDAGLQEAQAVHIRTVLARKLMKSRDWEWQRRERSDSITVHLGPAVAVILFNDYGSLEPAKCYLHPKGIERIDPFLPLLREVAETGTFVFVTIALLNLLEVAPQPSHLPLILAASRVWLMNHPDDRVFWIDHAIGRRLCSIIGAILANDPIPFASGQPTRLEIDALLTALVPIGVPEAYGLEEALSLPEGSVSRDATSLRARSQHKFA